MTNDMTKRNDKMFGSNTTLKEKKNLWSFTHPHLMINFTSVGEKDVSQNVNRRNKVMQIWNETRVSKL